MIRNSDKAVLNKGNSIKIAKCKINAIDWYVPLYTPSLEQQRVLMQQVVDKIPTELRYPERSVFMKKVKTQNIWKFEVGTQEGINVPLWIYTAFQQSDRQNVRNQNNNDKLVRIPIATAQCIIGTEKYPDVGIL